MCTVSIKSRASLFEVINIVTCQWQLTILVTLSAMHALTSIEGNYKEIYTANYIRNAGRYQWDNVLEIVFTNEALFTAYQHRS